MKFPNLRKFVVEHCLGKKLGSNEQLVQELVLELFQDMHDIQKESKTDAPNFCEIGLLLEQFVFLPPNLHQPPHFLECVGTWSTLESLIELCHAAYREDLKILTRAALHG